MNYNVKRCKKCMERYGYEMIDFGRKLLLMKILITKGFSPRIKRSFFTIIDVKRRGPL